MVLEKRRRGSWVIGKARRATRRSEFAAEVIRELADEKNLHLQYMSSARPAREPSASKLAAEELPSLTRQPAQRRVHRTPLEDPLAELVKIDPGVVGVGQYQHDMPQKRLNETLDGWLRTA